MSKLFREKYGDMKLEIEDIREKAKELFVLKGRRNEKGKLIYITEQAHKDSCDVNKIINKYDKTGLLTHVNEMEIKYGNVSGIEYKEMMDKIVDIKQQFDQMPSSIRKRFANSPEIYLNFMDDESNRDEAIKLGLIRGDSKPEGDGIGEHLKSPEEAR